MDEPTRTITALTICAQFTPAVMAEQIAVAVKDYQCAMQIDLVSKTSQIIDSEAQTISSTLEGDSLRTMAIDKAALIRGQKLISMPWH